MTITREEIVRDLAKRTNFYQRDIRAVLSEFDKLVQEYFATVTDDDEVSIQLVEGIKVGCYIVEPRDRVDPRTREPIIVKATCKPFSKFSETFREKIQINYEDSKSTEDA